MRNTYNLELFPLFFYVLGCVLFCICSIPPPPPPHHHPPPSPPPLPPPPYLKFGKDEHQTWIRFTGILEGCSAAIRADFLQLVEGEFSARVSEAEDAQIAKAAALGYSFPIRSRWAVQSRYEHEETITGYATVTSLPGKNTSETL